MEEGDAAYDDSAEKYESQVRVCWSERVYPTWVDVDKISIARAV